MPRNIQPPRHPDLVIARDVVQEALQGGDAPGPTEQTAVHADAHHGRLVLPIGIALRIQGVKGVFEVLEKRVRKKKMAGRMVDLKAVPKVAGSAGLMVLLKVEVKVAKTAALTVDYSAVWRVQQKAEMMVDHLVVK